LLEPKRSFVAWQLVSSTPIDRRAQLLQVALDLFDERGVRGASMRELARRAGVNVAATYHHFPSKQELLRALFREKGYFVAELDNPGELFAFLRSLDAEDALTYMLEGAWAILEEGARHFRLIHVEVLYGDEDARAVGLEMWEQWGRLLADVLVGAGLVDEDRAAEWADVLRAQLWGVFNETRLTGDVSPEQFRARARLVASLLAPAVKATRRPRRVSPKGADANARPVAPARQRRSSQ
jgi:AcrR family transcriptional regulator